MSADTAGWTKQTNPQEFRADFRINSKEGTVNSKANAIVITNKGSGDYSVYRDNGLLPGIGTKAYTFDADTGGTTVTNQVEFDKLFTGDNAQQFTNLNSITKKATIGLAKEAIINNDQQTLTNWTNLINSPGYISLGKNAGTNNPNDQNDDLRDGSPKPAGGFATTNRVEKTSMTVGGSKEVLRYPRQSLSQFGYDYIQIKAFDYEASGIDVGPNKKAGSGFAGSGGNRFKNSYETIQLPMQPNLSESMGVGWGENQLNALQANLASAAEGAIEKFGIGGKGSGKKIIDAGKELLKNAKDEDSKAAIAAYFAGQAIGNNNLVTRSTGNVINNNLELLFTGPSLRSFNFNFTLTPRDREEARIVRKIIKSMKRNMSPQRSESHLFLKSPRIFELQYIYGEGNMPHPFMNKFKPCACRNFSVNYTPDGSYMTYAGEPSMTSYQITMAFGEIEPIYADEYKDNNSPTMGF
tara:strand:+ start:274 stop:1674 length:1401 start_codon:yes stop_codon:yes gene_type:complete